MSQSSGSAKACFIFVGALVIVVACIGIAGSLFAPKFVTPYDGAIKMVQPNGITSDRDAKYAGDVNLPNSQSNLNNAQAEAELQRAQAEWNQAQTERKRAEADYANSPAGALDRVQGFGGFCISALLLIGLVLYIVNH